MRSFETRRQILLRQMLPHTCLGHPVASMLTMVGCIELASDVHYYTLPARTKRRLKRADVTFNPDERLRVLDLVFTPICSIARAFGFYRFAAWVFKLGPHEVALELESCNYEYSNQARNGYPYREREFTESSESKARQQENKAQAAIARHQQALEEQARLLEIREQLLERRLGKLYERESLLEDEESIELDDEDNFNPQPQVEHKPAKAKPEVSAVNLFIRRFISLRDES